MYITIEDCKDFNHLYRFVVDARITFIETLKEATDYCDTYGFDRYLKSLNEDTRRYKGNDLDMINSLISTTQLWSDFIFTDGWDRFLNELEENLNEVRIDHDLEIKKIF